MNRHLKRLILPFLLFMSACSMPQKQVMDKSLNFQDISGGELLNRLQKRNTSIKSLEGRLSNKIINGKLKKASTQLIILEKPSSIRIDVLTPFGSPALSMATDGEDIGIHYHTKRRFFAGRAEEENISRIISTSLDLEDFTSILSGNVPLISFDKFKTSVSFWDEGYILTLRNERVREEIFFDGSGLYPLKGIIYGPGNQIVMSVTMDKYKDVKGTPFPMLIKLSMPIEKYDMKIKYSNVALNEYSGPEIFRLNPPDGLIVENIETLNF